MYKYNLIGPFSVAHVYVFMIDHMGLDNLSGAHPWRTLTLLLSELINYLELFM